MPLEIRSSTLPLWPERPLPIPTPKAPAPPTSFGHRELGFAQGLCPGPGHTTRTRGDLHLLPSALTVGTLHGCLLDLSPRCQPGSACPASHFFSGGASLDSPSLAKVNSQRKSSLPRQFYFLINSAPFGNCFPSVPSPVLPPEASVTCSQLTFPHQPLLFLLLGPDPLGEWEFYLWAFPGEECRAWLSRWGYER